MQNPASGGAVAWADQTAYKTASRDGQFDLPSNTLAAPEAWKVLFEEVAKLTEKHRVEILNCLSSRSSSLQRSSPSASPEKLQKPMNYCDNVDSEPVAWEDHPFVVAPRNGQPTELEVAPTMIESESEVSFPLTPRPSTPVIAEDRDIHPRENKGNSKNEKLFGRKSVLVRMAEKQPLLQRIVGHRGYEWFSGTLIVLNAAFIGWHTQHEATERKNMIDQGLNPEDAEVIGFKVAQYIFCLLFIAELLLRWVAAGLFVFLRGDDLGWNALDVGIVAISAIDTIAGIAMDAMGAKEQSPFAGLSMLRIVRAVRIVRVVQVIRVMRFFRELRMMVFSTIASLKSLLWVIIVFLMVFYIFGIAFVQAATQFLDSVEKWNNKDNEILILYWSSIDRAILSLYSAMSGGNDWSAYSDALLVMGGVWHSLFLLYITFAIFAVVNIVTGIFVDTAMQTGSADRELQVHEQLQEDRDHQEAMAEVFEALDVDGDGCLTKSELVKAMDTPNVIAFFKSLGLDMSDAETVFDVLDMNGDGSVTLGELTKACSSLRGEASKLDSKNVLRQLMQVRDILVHVDSATNEILRNSKSALQATYRQRAKAATSSSLKSYTSQ